MKISISSYSFNQLFKTGAMTQFDTIAKSKEMGADAIEFVDIQAPKDTSKEEYAVILANECKKNSLPISCFTFSADFLQGSNGDTDKEIERVKKMIDIAEILDTDLVRHDASRGDGRAFDVILPIIADACRQVTEYAHKKGIRTTVENHGFFCQDSYRMEKLYARVNHPNFGLLADMGNFLCADEEPDKAFSRLAAYTFYTHAKDFHFKSAMLSNPGQGFFTTRGGNYLRGAIIGHGDVPIKTCLSALKQANYTGYVGIEFEGMEEPIEAIQIGLDNLRRYIYEL